MGKNVLKNLFSPSSSPSSSPKLKRRNDKESKRSSKEGQPVEISGPTNVRHIASGHPFDNVSNSLPLNVENIRTNLGSKDIEEDSSTQMQINVFGGVSEDDKHYPDEIVDMVFDHFPEMIENTAEEAIQNLKEFVSNALEKIEEIIEQREEKAEEQDQEIVKKEKENAKSALVKIISMVEERMKDLSDQLKEQGIELKEKDNRLAEIQVAKNSVFKDKISLENKIINLNIEIARISKEHDQQQLVSQQKDEQMQNLQEEKNNLDKQIKGESESKNKIEKNNIISLEVIQNQSKTINATHKVGNYTLGISATVFAMSALTKALVKAPVIGNWMKGFSLIPLVSTIGMSLGLGGVGVAVAHKSSTSKHMEALDNMKNKKEELTR